VRALIVIAVLAAGCGVDFDEPWELDHDRIVAVRATPPRIPAGGRAELDALISLKGIGTSERPPEAALVVAPTSLASALGPESGKWIVTAPDEAQLAAARTELGLAADAPVPLQVGVAYNSMQLGAIKTIWLGEAADNPTLSEMTIDGEPMEVMTELVVPRLVDVRFSIAADVEDDVNWLTSFGEMHDFDLPEAYLRVEEDEEATAGELAVVRRDDRGGVAWHVWPIRGE